MTYLEYVKNLIIRKEIGEPIYTNLIAKEVKKEFCLSDKDALLATSVAFKRIIDSGFIDNLRCYQKGIYYLCKNTVFGETKINFNQLIYDKYLSNDNGYISGPSFIQQLGLTTQMSKDSYITTNKATNGRRRDKKLGIVIIPPKTTITNENIKYLQLLDVLESMDKIPIDTDFAFEIIASRIDDDKEYKDLLMIADRHYDKKTIINLAHVANARGYNHETSFRQRRI